MAHSKPQARNTAQHYLECGMEDCERHCQFYCNPCHQPLCQQCRDEHKKSPKTKKHEVVPFMERKLQLPVEKCTDHPTKDIDILCDQCNLPICSKCATMSEHKGHSFTDLETIYTEKSAACQKEISNIHTYFLPTASDLQREVQVDVTEIKKLMDNIRSSMRDEAKSLKQLVDEVTSDNVEEADKMEESLMKMLHSQDRTYQDYISYLQDLVIKFHGYFSSTKIQSNLMLSSLSELLKIKLLPQTARPVLPVFTAGKFSKEDVTKLLGRMSIPDTKPVNREIKPMETALTSRKPTEKQKKQDGKKEREEREKEHDREKERNMKQDREKSDVKLTLSLLSTVTEVREYTAPGVNRVLHMSLDKSGRLWASDNKGNLVQTDLQGNQLQQIQTCGSFYGYHTVPLDGDLIYTDEDNKVIYKITQDNKVTELFKTEGWMPVSIHSSHINGDILVGMFGGKVIRYNKTGTEIQSIEKDSKGQDLYSGPIYITENINGDICVSDSNKDVLVVVEKSGQHRFSYTGQGSKFSPRGVCNDLLGHIIVCDYWNDTVDLLDQDGQFLSHLLTKQQGVKDPWSVCVDDENNLLVGQRITNTVKVYKYLQ